MKHFVDNAKPESLIPKCQVQIQAQLIKDNGGPIQHLVHLEGAKDPYNAFNIHIEGMSPNIIEQVYCIFSLAKNFTNGSYFVLYCQIYNFAKCARYLPGSSGWIDSYIALKIFSW